MGAEMHSPGYFRVPLAIVQAIAEANPDPDVLAAWLILRRFAYGKQRELTATGAKKIASALSMTRPRATGLIRDLLAMRHGQRGGSAVLLTASEWNDASGHHVPAMRANAPVYVMPDPGGEYAYLPDLLIPPGEGQRSYLAGLCELDPTLGLDAIRTLILGHAAMSCGDFLGADPNAFARTDWELTGSHDEFELGYLGAGNGRHYWLAREAENASTTWSAIEAATGGRDDVHAKRFWAALNALAERGLLYRAAIVSDTRGRLAYPLWVYGESHRDRLLASFGVVGDLASHFHRQATRAGIDVADELARKVMMEGEFGAFICATTSVTPPTIRTIYAPTLLAPTPDNIAGMASVAQLTYKWH